MYVYKKNLYPWGKKNPGKPEESWGTLIKLSHMKFIAHNPCPLFLHFHATSSGERKKKTSLYSSIQVTRLSYSGGEVPELFSHTSHSKNKSPIPIQWEKATCPKFILHNEFQCRKRSWGWLCEHIPSQIQQLQGVLKSPGGIFSGKLFCTSQPVFRFQASPSSHLPALLPPQPQAQWSQMSPGQQYSPWDQMQVRLPLALEWWITCFGHPAWASNPLSNSCLKDRELCFPLPWVWLFYLTSGIEMQACHYCHRKVSLKKKDTT